MNELENFENHLNLFGTVLKIWHKNSSGRTAFLETLQAEIKFQRFFYILRKWLILQEKFSRLIQKYAYLFCDTI